MFLKKLLKNQKGAMDRILVTLLLVIIAVGGMAGLGAFFSDERNDLQNIAESSIDNTVS